MLASPAPAAAQGELGAGVSFLNGEGGTGPGFTIDYSRVFHPLNGGSIGWVADLSMHTDDDVRITTIMGGVRYGREANERLNWFVQALVGLGRTSFTGDLGDFCEEFADEFGGDCGSNDLAFAPGVGVNVPLTPRVSFRAQLDFLIMTTEGETFDGRRVWFGVSLPVGGNP